MIDSTEVPEAAAQPQAPEWLPLWERPAPSSGVTCGMQGRLMHGRKSYRAWAEAEIGDDRKRLESDIYEACDAADVDQSRMRHGSIVGEHVEAREIAQREAETARALMAENQRSPLDMAAIAYGLAEQLATERNAWYVQWEAAQRQAAYDADAVKAYDLIERGFIVRHGEEALRRLLDIKQKRA